MLCPFCCGAASSSFLWLDSVSFVTHSTLDDHLNGVQSLVLKNSPLKLLYVKYCENTYMFWGSGIARYRVCRFSALANIAKRILKVVLSILILTSCEY